jgi:mannose-6-phosphate isomerase-like protein (cupin superfamily)
LSGALGDHDPRPHAILREPQDAERQGIGAIRLTLEDIYMAEYELEPGSEPGTPHYHARHSDTFYVLDGELEFVIAGRTVRAKAGTVLAAPRGAIHAFPVAIGGRARFLNLHTPGGFERYIRELAAMRARGETPTDEFFRAHDQFNV